MSKEITTSPSLIEKRILLIRGRKVMLSGDLAELYEVQPKVLMQAVKRNAQRFPLDLMFQLTADETRAVLCHALGSRSQNVTLKRGQHAKYAPYAFTEEGVAMLSSVLKSQRAIQVNIAIMRAFVRLRDIVTAHKEIARKLEELEHKLELHDKQIREVFEVIRYLVGPERKARRRIGFEVTERG